MKQSVSPSLKLKIIVAFISVAVLGLVYQQYSITLESELELLTKRGEHQARILNESTRTALKTAAGLRVAAEHNLSHPTPPSTGRSGTLQAIPEKNGYGLVAPPAPGETPLSMSLTGLGPLDNEPDLATEREVSLSLEPMMRWVKGVYPEAPWVYYLSRHRFMTIHPSLSLDDFFMDDRFYDMDLYISGTPEGNPLRAPYITKVYLDEAGQGLMVSFGAPVYRGDAFMGIVAFDLTLKVLSDSLRKYHYPGDNTYLVNDRAEVIAVAGDDYPDETLSRKRSLPELRPGLFEFSRSHPNQTQPLGFQDAFVLSRELRDAPWFLITERSKWQVYRSAVWSTLPLIALLTLIIASMLAYMRESRRQRQIASERSLRRFRTLLDSSTDMIAVVDPGSGLFLDVNKTMCEFMGTTRQAMLATRVFDLSGRIKSSEGWVRSVKRIRKTKRITLEDSGERPDGRPFLVELNIHLAEEDGQEYLVSVVRDISRRKQEEDERRLLEIQLQNTKKMEAMGQLTGGIAHDFESILAAIMSSAELGLGKAGSNTGLRDSLRQILKSGDRARSLVRQMLVYSRGENPKTAEPVAIVPELKEILTMVRPLLSTMVEIRTQWPGSSPIILIDPPHLQQILVNLCINARDAMPAGGVLTIGVSESAIEGADCRICQQQVSGVWVRIRVQDSGTGILPSLSDKIFEPFFTTKQVGDGGGMGLSVVQGIVTTYGGHILMDTKVGGGTKFELLFPPAHKAIEEPQLDASNPGPPLELSGKRVLLVDDEPVVRLYMERVLESADAVLTTCASGVEALEEFRRAPNDFDLIITDQAMPGISGIALAREIRWLNESVPIMLFSGHVNSVCRKQLAELKICEMQKKPVTADEFTTAVKQVLAHP